MGSIWLPLVLLCAAWLVIGRRRAAQIQRILQEQLAAYRRGDYRAQLRIVEGLRGRMSEPPHYLYFRGAACFQLGRLREAEEAVRRSLAAGKDAARKVMCRDQLGRIFMEQQRWDDAIACFRECIEEAPHRAAGHSALAEVLLRRGCNDGTAWNAARLAVACGRAEKTARGELPMESDSAHHAESLAVLAWALARNHGDPAEIESMLGEAFPCCGEARPVLASVHFYAGHAWAQLGNSAASRRHFQSAGEIDPCGNYGRLSLATLATPLQPAAGVPSYK